MGESNRRGGGGGSGQPTPKYTKNKHRILATSFSNQGGGRPPRFSKLRGSGPPPPVGDAPACHLDPQIQVDGCLRISVLKLCEDGLTGKLPSLIHPPPYTITYSTYIHHGQFCRPLATGGAAVSAEQSTRDPTREPPGIDTQKPRLTFRRGALWWSLLSLFHGYPTLQPHHLKMAQGRKFVSTLHPLRLLRTTSSPG